MTNLSINLNKVALLRNSRGRDFPNLIEFAQKCLDLGVQGLTIHPRQDQRHITKQDAVDLSEYLKNKADIELNIEGYPSEDFLSLVEGLKPAQCSFVPDGPDQLTSDHGWNLLNNHEFEFVKAACERINEFGIRTAIFLDPDVEQVKKASETGASRIELYTETYASNFATQRGESVFSLFREAALEAQQNGIGVNAGHDLDLNNLSHFLSIPDILEVSIGHALIVECIERGLENVVKQYLDICN